ncbi:MAG: hypothetical protein QM768_03120 [Agriterribacter sp.]
MQTTTKHVISLAIIGLFFVMAIASSPSKGSMTVAKHQIPPDFNGYKGTLLIISQSRSWNRYAEKYFSNNYSGKYKIIQFRELEKYPVGEEYKYVLKPEYNQRMQAGSSHSYTSSQNLCVIDRATNQQYCTKSASHYAALIKKYAKALEEERTRQ